MTLHIRIRDVEDKCEMLLEEAKAEESGEKESDRNRLQKTEIQFKNLWRRNPSSLVRIGALIKVL